MQAIIITIGDELLIGQTIDTNSAWMGQELNKLGIWVIERIAISDDKQHIIDTLNKNISRADIILFTGGLGPTKDDLTKHVLTEYFNGKLILNDEVLQHVTEIFSRRNLPMLEVNTLQAMVPDNCKVLFNQLGTAPGMMWQVPFSNGEGLGMRCIIAMPGVPFEMKHLMQTHVLPMVATISNSQVHHRTLITAGIGESFLAKKIEHFENNLPTNIKLAYLPAIGMVKLRLTTRGFKDEDLETALNKHFEALKTAVKEYLFADNDELLEVTIGNLLLQHKATLSVAESCTGGFIASKLVSIAGSSQYFEGGVVSYSYQAKQNLLNVKKETLDKHGAVSEECVKEMVEGTLAKFNTTYSIAVSGIAGPDGGTEDKPVGTVWIAVGTKNKMVAKKFNFSKDRFRNIELTYVFALKMLMDEITNS
jgi:nicotinamide-nucleotide amidase